MDDSSDGRDSKSFLRDIMGLYQLRDIEQNNAVHPNRDNSGLPNLTKDECEEKLADPNERSNFKFFVNKKARSLIWDRFFVVFYNGMEQNFAKCRYCDVIFENDSSRVTKQLHRHECQGMLVAIDGTSNEGECEEISSSVSQTVSKDELQAVLNNPDVRDLVTFISKDPQKCPVWEHLDLVYYKNVQQNYASCKHCHTLVPYSSKVGTATIRKHILKCPNIPKNCDESYYGTEDDEDNDVMDCSMLIPEVVYEAGYKEEAPIEETIVLDGNDEDGYSDQENTEENTFDKFQLMDLYEDPKERSNFTFEKPKHNDDAEYWKTFEYVVYKNVRQKYCRCTQCGVYINFVSTRRRGLARHMRSCNKRWTPTSTPKNVSIPITVVELKSTPARKVAPVTLRPIAPKPQKLPTPSTSNSKQQQHQEVPCLTPQLAAALTSPQNVLQSHLQNTPLKSQILSKKERNLPLDLRNQLILNQLSFVVNDTQSLDFLDGDSFREFAQTLVNIGAEHGPHRIDEILTTKETLVKYWVPTKVSKCKKLFREILFQENHLNLSVDLYENKNHKTLNFKYFLTVTCHVINQSFLLKALTLGSREFSQDITSDDILKAFLKIVGEFYDTESLPEKCYIVTRDNELLTKAFSDYIRLPSVTDNIRNIFNEMLVCDELTADVTDNVKKIEKLFAYLRENYSYHMTATDSILEQIEEFYEMFETIKKLLKDKKDHQRLMNISRHQMKTVINFLELVKLCLETLKGSNQSSISGVLLWQKKLMEHYQPALHEHKLMEELKRMTIKHLEEKLDTGHDFYKIGLFLNPNFKSLKILSTKERDSVLDMVLTMIGKINEPNVNGNVGPPPFKKSKFEATEDIFGEYCDKNGSNGGANLSSPPSNNSAIQAEVTKYSNDNRIINQSNDDILDFWFKCKQFPNLRKLAQKMLSIPTCSNGIDETLLLNANRSYREVFGTSQSQSLLNIEEFHSVIFLNRNYSFIEELE